MDAPFRAGCGATSKNTVSPARRRSGSSNAPVRISGPWVSSMMGTGYFTLRFNVFTQWTASAAWVCVAWDMLSRTTDMPAAYSCSIIG